MDLSNDQNYLALMLDFINDIIIDDNLQILKVQIYKLIPEWTNTKICVIQSQNIEEYIIINDTNVHICKKYIIYNSKKNIFVFGFWKNNWITFFILATHARK
jgi:hypothetical protein